MTHETQNSTTVFTVPSREINESVYTFLKYYVNTQFDVTLPTGLKSFKFRIIGENIWQNLCFIDLHTYI